MDTQLPVDPGDTNIDPVTDALGSFVMRTPGPRGRAGTAVPDWEWLGVWAVRPVGVGVQFPGGSGLMRTPCRIGRICSRWGMGKPAWHVCSARVGMPAFQLPGWEWRSQEPRAVR
jgi:hypothetical protein